MPWFAVYSSITGRLVSTGTVVDKSDADLAAEGLAKKTLAFNPQVPTKRWNEASRDFDDVVPPKDKLDGGTFLRRFTVAEREDIFNAARTAKKLHAFIEMVKVAGVVDPNDPDMIAAVNRMETAGLIGPGRAAEVLV